MSDLRAALDRLTDDERRLILNGLAMRRGYRCMFDPTEFLDWTHTTFTLQREEPA